MAYTDPFYHFPPFSGTSTASATTGVNVTAQLGDFVRATNINQLRVVVLTAPAAGQTGMSIALMNGTATVGTAALGTSSAAGNGVDFTLTASNAYIGARAPLTAVVTGTATVSGASIGTFVIEVQ